MSTNEWKAASLSRKHDGQIVRPVVEYRYAGPHGRIVRWATVDRSLPPGSQQGEWTEIRGTPQECHDGLQAVGILVDDHRF